VSSERRVRGPKVASGRAVGEAKVEEGTTGEVGDEAAVCS
jgi:hypothetical protein